MSNGVGTSKEDKRRKRRSLPYEKKPQADKARLKKSLSGKTTSDLDKSMISRIYALARGVISPGKAVSDKDFINALKKIRDAKKKGKPHLKKGGKAK
tara:strand:- start:306 stop:596 length:291 start_codon:yes stop_codon:yes gene_type:complete